MYDLLFLVLVLIYFLFSLKLEEWLTISRLGFLSETPEGFIKNPRAYFYIAYSILIVAVIVSIRTTVFPWYVSLGIIIFCFFASGIKGRIKAIKLYKEIISDLLKTEKDPETIKYIKEELNKSNLQIINRVKNQEKLDVMFKK